MPNKDVPQRDTEGPRKGSPGRPGRPPGARNKPKGAIGRVQAAQLLDAMKDQLSAEQFDYLVGVVKDGKPIQTKNELDTVIALTGRSLIPALVAEMLPEEDGGSGGKYKRDINDRLKSFKDMLALRHQIEKHESPDDDSNQQTILTLRAKRGVNLDRIGILIGGQPALVGGNADGDRRSADEVGTLPDQLPERPLLVSSSQQSPPDRILDGAERGEPALAGDEDEL